MNIFILNTGRCGSTTIIEACKHIDNFSSAHESRVNLLGDERINYPDNHIEGDNRLSWFLGALDKQYGKNAFYVHLKRNIPETARSYVKRFDSGIIKAYRRGILIGQTEGQNPTNIAEDYCHTVTKNIQHSLKDKPNKMEMQLENLQEDFNIFWEKIGAEGDLHAAKEKLSTSYNTSREKPRGIRYKVGLKLIKLGGDCELVCVFAYH